MWYWQAASSVAKKVTFHDIVQREHWEEAKERVETSDAVLYNVIYVVH